MSINELFNTESNASTNPHILNGTAELTHIANSEATRIIREMEANIDVYRERIAQSSKDMRIMDEIIREFKPWDAIEEGSMLRSLSEETVESMLRSQQSKRSRTKGKAMTLDNYRTLLSAAIAEETLREIYNKPKSAHVGVRSSGPVDFTPAQLERLAEDQEALRKEIRNIQSKKSIMKRKPDFDESDERWLALLKAETMLKDLRVREVVEVDHTKNQLTELLGDIDIESLKAHDSKELLARISDMLK